MKILPGGVTIYIKNPEAVSRFAKLIFLFNI